MNKGIELATFLISGYGLGPLMCLSCAALIHFLTEEPTQNIPKRKALQMYIKYAVFQTSLPVLFEVLNRYYGIGLIHHTFNGDYFQIIACTILRFLLVDFFMYSSHRLQHKFSWEDHREHHSFHHKDMNSFAGFALGPIDGVLTSACHILPAFIVPQHIALFYFSFVLDSLWAGFIHNAGETKLWFPLNSAYHHQIHHNFGKRNCNFGHFTLIWDLVFGTLKHDTTVQK